MFLKSTAGARARASQGYLPNSSDLADLDGNCDKEREDHKRLTSLDVEGRCLWSLCHTSSGTAGTHASDRDSREQTSGS